MNPNSNLTNHLGGGDVAIGNDQALVAVLDRLEHHKNNGTFKILESLQQPT